jgi:hypothetical protein
MLLSVIITVVDGGSTLRTCLEAVLQQTDPPQMEILVPFDDSVRGIKALRDQYPGVRFIEMGTVSTRSPKNSHAGQHELFDYRRATGLARSNGELIAILEDRGVPQPDWARVISELHHLPHAVVGGAIENGVDKPLNWAVYFCDFGRYQLPLASGQSDSVSDVNICYKRAPLYSVRHVWGNRYHETTTHWALQRNGYTFFLDSRPIVEQRRRDLSLGGLLAERFHWGRLFAYTRGRECGSVKRALLAMGSLLLPVVLFTRHATTQWRKRVRLTRFVAAAPAMLLLLISWSAGELVGYVTGDS